MTIDTSFPTTTDAAAIAAPIVEQLRAGVERRRRLGIRRPVRR